MQRTTRRTHQLPVTWQRTLKRQARIRRAIARAAHSYSDALDVVVAQSHRTTSGPGWIARLRAAEQATEAARQRMIAEARALLTLRTPVDA